MIAALLVSNGNSQLVVPRSHDITAMRRVQYFCVQIKSCIRIPAALTKLSTAVIDLAISTQMEKTYSAMPVVSMILIRGKKKKKKKKNIARAPVRPHLSHLPTALPLSIRANCYSVQAQYIDWI